MELNQYFSVFILAMCAVDLISTASAHISHWWRKYTHQPQGAMAMAAAKSATLHGQRPQRGDWYAFFHCSDLVGSEPAKGDIIAQGKNDRAQHNPISKGSSPLARSSSKRSGPRLTLS
jgi:hypothetical protein